MKISDCSDHIRNNVQCPKITSGEYASCSECKGVFRSAVTDEFSELSAYLSAFIKNVTNKSINNTSFFILYSLNLNCRREKFSLVLP